MRAVFGMDSAAPLRGALVALAGLGVVGTGIELAMDRHWRGFEQLIPWVAVAAGAIALVLLLAKPGVPAVWTVRLLALAILVIAVVGVWRHTVANYHAGPLDFRYEKTWATMSSLRRWWTAFSKTVGPAPTLAPGVLVQVGLALLFATWRHPALRRADDAQVAAAEAPRAEGVTAGSR